MRWAPLFLIAAFAMAETPADVVDFVRTAAEALSEKNQDVFLDHFDSKMPGYVMLRDEIETLMISDDLATTVEILMDEGDEKQRSLDLDWELQVNDQQPKRAIVKCRMEKQGKKWKITALEPIEFFKY